MTGHGESAGASPGGVAGAAAAAAGAAMAAAGAAAGAAGAALAAAGAAAAAAARPIGGLPAGAPPPDFDSDLYSRQIGAFGMETMGKLMAMRVLISGLDGAAVEAAKNLILSGPRQVVLHDPAPCRLADLAASFAIAEEDVAVGRSRAAAAAPRLAQLNNHVSVSVCEEPALSEEVLGNFDVVVLGGSPLLPEAVRVNAACRERGIPFIAFWVSGLAAAVFADFGATHRVHDSDGELPVQAIIEGVSVCHSDPAKCFVHLHQDGRGRRFAAGTYVKFLEVRGMEEVNAAPPARVAQSDKNGVTVELDVRAFAPYAREGILQQVKMPYTVEYRPLAECLARPVPAGCFQLASTDMGKMGRAEQLHFAFLGLNCFRAANGGAHPGNKEAIAQCQAMAVKANAEAKELAAQPAAGPAAAAAGPAAGTAAWLPAPVDSVDLTVTNLVARFSTCVISPVASFIGGVVAQEIVKQTGKFVPLRQWLYYDCFELVDAAATVEQPVVSAHDLPSRFGPQLAIFGADFLKRMAALRVFLVGAGALGCELLKAFALMGCATRSGGGQCIVTDMDRIEVSNLSRQFLFRREHVGKPKSGTAARAAIAINPDFDVRALEARVGPETEDQFTDEFWEGLSVVANALDNVPSRLYIDGRCVWFHKPLLESGTLGTKANSQVVVPKLTESYGDSRDPPEESIPLCTLRHFPNQIEHTIEWSRDQFQGLFCDEPREAVSFIENPKSFLARLQSEGTETSQVKRLIAIRRLLDFVRTAPSYKLCVARAIRIFCTFFTDQIADLVANFPPDHVTSAGVPFWSGPKRCPNELKFDPEDPLHLAFVHTAANLFLCMTGTKEAQRDPAVCQHVAREVVRENAAAAGASPEETRLLGAPKMRVDEKGDVVEDAASSAALPAGSAFNTVSVELKNLVQDIPEDRRKNLLHPIDFEKDDDANFHIDFIHACANLRARNYRIAECPRHRTKIIAGKIIPAVATTTAMITGLVTVEFLKLVNWRERKLEDYRNGFVNLAEPSIFLVEPVQPPKTVDTDHDPITQGPVKARPNGFTPWDTFDLSLKSDGTLQDVIDAVSKTFNVEVSILSVGNACLYNQYLPAHKGRLSMRVRELVEQVWKRQLSPGRRSLALEASCCDLDDSSDVVIPTIKLILP